jgi:hypothetical protein
MTAHHHPEPPVQISSPRTRQNSSQNSLSITRANLWEKGDAKVTPVDYFISYTSPDKIWAEWIGWVLEEAGATVCLQAWDFAPGSNFVLEMQRATASAHRTIAVLSPDYLTSRFAAPEWAAAFEKDPEGLSRSLVPVQVRDCALEGMLRTIVHIDLVGLDEVAARKQLSDRLGAKRGKPDRAPSFPGTAPVRQDARNPKAFPGASPGSAAGSPTQPAPYIPNPTVLPGSGQNKGVAVPNPNFSNLQLTDLNVYGRRSIFGFLNKYWEDPKVHIVTLVAWGGIGKTAIINSWLNQIREYGYCGASSVCAWSFYNQGKTDNPGADPFLDEALYQFGSVPEGKLDITKAHELAQYIRSRRTLLILDGIEPLVIAHPGR